MTYKRGSVYWCGGRFQRRAGPAEHAPAQPARSRADGSRLQEGAGKSPTYLSFHNPLPASRASRSYFLNSSIYLNGKRV